MEHRKLKKRGPQQDGAIFQLLVMVFARHYNPKYEKRHFD